MATIVAGRFETQAAADEAQSALARTGFAPAEYRSFYLAPPGQHDHQYPGGGDAHHDEGPKHSGKSAAPVAATGGARELR